MGRPDSSAHEVDIKQSRAELPNRPQAKLPPLPKGTRIKKRPLLRRLPSRASSTPFNGGGKTLNGSASGYSGNPRVIYVSTGAPFMAVVKRVLKVLENSPQKTKGMPLNARIAALGVGVAETDSRGKDGDGEKERDEVLVVGTGRAIEKTLNVAAWLNRRKDLKVSLRTRSVGAVDDVVPVDGEGGRNEDGEDGDDTEMAAAETARLRWVSCLEVGVRIR